MAHAHAALLATEEERPAATHQDGRAAALGLRQVARDQHQVKLRTKVLHVHQWGISLPRACETLCHWPGTIEPMVANVILKPLVAADACASVALWDCTLGIPLLGPSGSINLILSPCAWYHAERLGHETRGTPIFQTTTLLLSSTGVCDEWVRRRWAGFRSGVCF